MLESTASESYHIYHLSLGKNTIMTTEHTTYAQAFTQLEKISQQLSQQELIDIDQLLPLVDDAMSAYQFCQARITAVENLLTEKLKTIT